MTVEIANFVYLFGTDTRQKIGRTNAVHARLQQIQLGLSEELEVWYVVGCLTLLEAAALEARMHLYFEPCWIGWGEWFNGVTTEAFEQGLKHERDLGAKLILPSESEQVADMLELARRHTRRNLSTLKAERQAERKAARQEQRRQKMQEEINRAVVYLKENPSLRLTATGVLAASCHVGYSAMRAAKKQLGYDHRTLYAYDTRQGLK